MTTILCIIFFFSGASALIYELLWFQLSGLTFGNSVWATSIVLSAFMAGLALGNGLAAFWGHKFRSPIRLYAFLEITIAVAGFSLVLLFPDLTRLLVPLFRAFSDHVFIINSFRAIIAFLLMLVPATAMGATLPILVKALYKAKPNFGRVLGILYGWNTLGAVAGVLTGELIFVKWFGIKGTGAVAAGFNLFAAAMALQLSRKNLPMADAPLRAEEPAVFSDFSFKKAQLLLASFLSGFTLLALEVVWFRFLLLFFFPSSRNFAVMLAMVLSGISLGGLFASKWFQMRSEAHTFIVPVLFLNGILVTVLYESSSISLYLFNNINDQLRLCLVSLFLIFPVSFISGIIFTMLGKALHGEMKVETKTTGLLTLANTIGSMLGSLIAVLILIPSIGIEKSFFLFACIYGGIAFLVLDKKGFVQLKGRFSLQHISVLMFVIFLFLFPFGLMNGFLEATCASYVKKDGMKRVAFREGLTETIQYLQKDLLGEPYCHRLLTNGHSMSGTNLDGRRYMKMFVYFPVAIHSAPKSALLICFGVGSTAKALTNTKSLEHIDIVDTSRDIVEMSSVVFDDPMENPVNDPRVKTYIEDGRYFLLATERKFDLITGEPPPPQMSGIVNLYTQEYFQLINDRLSDGGIVSYWLPVYQLRVSEAKSILKAFSNVFKHCSLWSGAGFEWVMVGIKNPQGPVSEKNFLRQWNDPVVGPDMKSLGIQSPEQLGSLFIADRKVLQNWTSDSLPLVDNYPRRLSYEDVIRGQHIPFYRDLMDPSFSQANFMKSEHISKIWPESLQRKAGPHFPFREMINDQLNQRPHRNTSFLVRLHSFVNNPLLEEYILWAFDSDVRAQRIISRLSKGKLAEQADISPDILWHLAAGAAQKRDYLLAEKYLRFSAEKQPIHQHRYRRAVIRMYLLLLSGKKDQAEQVLRDYINSRKADKDESKKEILRDWDWMLDNVSRKTGKLIEADKGKTISSLTQGH